jgi:hypothetical protein
MVKSKNLAVVVHITNQEKIKCIIDNINLLNKYFDIFITTNFTNFQFICKSLKNTTIEVSNIIEVEDRGRDFLPLLIANEKFNLSAYNFILKLHTDNTNFYSESIHPTWQENLFHDLIFENCITNTIELFKNNLDIGIAGPRNYLWKISKFFFHEKNILHWNNLIEINKPVIVNKEINFFAGGMFWLKGAILQKLAEIPLDRINFEINDTSIDGTLSHALERYISILSINQGYKIIGYDFSDFSTWKNERTLTDRQLEKLTYNLSNKNNISFKIFILINKHSRTENIKESIESITKCREIYKSIEYTTIIADELNTISNLVNINCSNDNFDWFTLIKAGDSFTRDSFILLADQLLINKKCNLLYTDKYLKLNDGLIESAFLPDYNFDLSVSFPWLLSSNWFFKRDIVVKDDFFERKAGDLFELHFIYRYIRNYGPQTIFHFSEPILTILIEYIDINIALEVEILQNHLNSLGYSNARVTPITPGTYKVLYNHNLNPLVSLIILTRDSKDLTNWIDNFIKTNEYENVELIINDNAINKEVKNSISNNLKSFKYLKVKFIETQKSDNESKTKNALSVHACGEFLFFIDELFFPLDGFLIINLLNHALRLNIGAVAPKLIDDNNKIYDAGLIIGRKTNDQAAFSGENSDNLGYLNRLIIDQSYSAVSTTCFLIRSSYFTAVNKFNEDLYFNDEISIELSLKLNNLKLINVFTPSSTVKFYKPPNPHTNNEPLKSILISKNYQKLIDPNYNRNLSLINQSFTAHPEPKFSWRPLDNLSLPKIMTHPCDDSACGQYRILKPLNYLNNFCHINGNFSFRKMLPAELELINPDSIIFQRPLSKDFIDYIKYVKKYTGIFTVYEIDDLITNIPIKNSAKPSHPKDTIKLLRDGISHVDRLIVSTSGLAESYSNYHSDIRILELKLPIEWWGDIHCIRSQSPKPRVGWAGGGTHKGDLELIYDVIKDLSTEIDWIFLGMCPPKLRPFIKEFHNGVPIHLYPQKLASLNLNLALAPLENNLFNDCKSNLRLLEYGACGIPVICSNTRAFTESKLPVQIVKNKYKQWSNAIRDHVENLDYCFELGKELKNSVNKNWMLDTTQAIKFLNLWSS